MRQDTLVFLLKPETEEILLAMKKRGFGEGKFNGVGGKVAPGEAIEAGAVREAHEEIGVEIEPMNLEKVAELQFSFQGKPDWSIHCHTFICRTWKGLPRESDEMAPQWFPISGIPYERMWIDDKYWLPLVLEGWKLDARFHFNPDGSEILSKSIVRIE